MVRQGGPPTTLTAASAKFAGGRLPPTVTRRTILSASPQASADRPIRPWAKTFSSVHPIALSMRLEPELWQALSDIREREAQDRGAPVRQVEAAGHIGGRTSRGAHLHPELLSHGCDRDRPCGVRRPRVDPATPGSGADTLRRLKVNLSHVEAAVGCGSRGGRATGGEGRCTDCRRSPGRFGTDCGATRSYRARRGANHSRLMGSRRSDLMTTARLIGIAAPDRCW